MVFVAKEGLVETSPFKERAGEFYFASDIDDLLADSWSDYIPPLNERFETKLSPQEVAVYGFVQNTPAWQAFGREFFDFMESLRADPKFVLNHQVVEGAVEGILAVTQIARLDFYLTSRPVAVYEETVSWLREHFFPEAPVFCRPSWVSPEEADEWKREVIKLSGINLVLEDNIWLAEILKVPTIIVERPHNKNITPKGAHIIKVSSWDRVPEEVALVKEDWLARNR